MLDIPKISIIIPSFNNLDQLKYCVKSIQQQKFKNYEIVIVDGNSTDGTVPFLKSLKSPFKFVSEKDQGIYDAMNKGVVISKGDWLYFMGADDQFYDDMILAKIASFVEGKKTDLILGSIEYVGAKRKKFVSSFSFKIWIKNTVHHQSVFYNRTVFKNYKYDTRFKVLGDYKLNLSLYKNKHTFLTVNEKVALCDPNGISKNYNWNLYKEDIALKVATSNKIFYPIFYVLGVFKYLMKNLGILK